jgi:dTDP-4-amino-4,6-dideoxygalactose transaminase
MRIPMSSPDLTDADVAAVNQVLATRYLSLGPKIEAFASGTEDAALASLRLS